MQLKAEAEPMRIGFKKKIIIKITYTMWISIKIFEFLNFNRAFEWLEKWTMRMAFPRRHIFTHTHMTDPPIVASHYFKEDFNS